MIELDLPIPPSVNRLHGKANRRVFRTTLYQTWLKSAGWELHISKPGKIEGPYRIEIGLPATMRGDADNRCKAVLDILVSMNVTDDDRHCQFVSAEKRLGVPQGRCLIKITRAEKGTP